MHGLLGEIKKKKPRSCTMPAAENSGDLFEEKNK
jgi:hypothetical protein